MDILAWLRAQPARERWYWDDNRDGSFVLGGIGVADVIRGETAIDVHAVLEHTHAMLGEDPRARLRGHYFGGMTFMPPPYVDGSWRHFGCYRFVLPRLEIVRTGKHHVMGLNLLPGDASPRAMDGIRDMLGSVATMLRTDAPTLPAILQRSDTPDRDGWETLLTHAIAHIRNGTMNKVALARKTSLTLGAVIDPLDLMWLLRREEPNTLEKSGNQPLAFDTRGSADDAAMVWLHGFLGAGRDWLPIVERLPGYYHVMLDLPGHGGSARCQSDGVFSFHGTARAIMATLEYLRLDKTIFIGYSLGARLALYVALRFSPRIRGLVMEGGSPGLEDETERRERLRGERGVRDALQSQPMAEFLDAWYDQPLFHSLKNHPDLLRRLRASRADNRVPGLCRAHEGLSVATQPNLWPELSRLSVPSLLIVGEQDDKYGGIARMIRARAAHIQVATVPGCGHNTHLEDPETFARLLLGWLTAEPEGMG
uniref:Putative 2-succinyl-6-hydroxy-2,4-cyclohexadiene-1-carboxylate synthase n=1 Tax=Candidatus Kentrum sp. TC TaxID=2126339 RepID=A0A450YPM9_9GAMM|nr:MAG: 2-succinyl-6-hydroxy-2,4-cyclohexadiene-1-carboxylate synthase [Candidatus Kentron sp. TC]